MIGAAALYICRSLWGLEEIGYTKSFRSKNAETVTTLFVFSCQKRTCDQLKYIQPILFDKDQFALDALFSLEIFIWPTYLQQSIEGFYNVLWLSLNGCYY